MKALSLKQPWANLIALRKKTIETRTWRTSYRGPLLICASKTVDPEAAYWWGRSGVPTDPTGCAICVCRLVDCRPMLRTDGPGACCEVYSPAHAWLLEDVHRIDPFPVRGRLGLFHVHVPLLRPFLA